MSQDPQKSATIDSLGKGEVHSSILCGSTTKTRRNPPLLVYPRYTDSGQKRPERHRNDSSLPGKPLGKMFMEWSCSDGTLHPDEAAARAHDDALKAAIDAGTSRPPSFVYFARRGTSRSRVKIGFAKDPFKRVALLQTGADEELNIIALLPGTLRDEGAIHREFARRRLIGEWFSVNETLRARIKQIQQEHGRWLNPRFGIDPPLPRVLGRRRIIARTKAV